MGRLHHNIDPVYVAVCGGGCTGQKSSSVFLGPKVVPNVVVAVKAMEKSVYAPVVGVGSYEPCDRRWYNLNNMRRALL